MAGRSEGLRERQRRRTRADISRAAVDLVCDRGLAGVTVEEIAEAAGVSQRTFFNYFPAKADALLTWVPSLDADALRRFTAGEGGGLIEGLRDLLVGFGKQLEDRHDEASRVRELLQVNPELRPLLHERLRAFEAELSDAVARRSGEDRESVGPATVAAITTAMFRAAFARWSTGGRDGATTDSLAPLLDEAVTAARRLLASPSDDVRPETA